MNKNTKIILLSIISVLIIITIVLGITYSFMRPINETSSITSVNLESCANITLTDTGESINLSNSYPMTKNRAFETTPYTFTVSSTCPDSSGFNLYLATLNTNTLSDNSIHYIITEHGNKNVIVEGILSEAANGLSDFESYEIEQLNNGINGTYGSIYTLYNGPLSDTETSYDLYLYIDESVTNETMGQTFSAGIAVKAGEYTPTLADTCRETGSNTLACHVATTYTTDGENGLYYHDADLANGAEDNSYRFAGGDYELSNLAISSGYTSVATTRTASNGVINFYCDDSKSYVGVSNCSSSYAEYYTTAYNETIQYSTYDEALEVAVSDGYLIKDNVNNYVCFGSDAVTCPSDNLYRIIGVFGDEVKLIKATSYGSYAWDADYNNTWDATTKPEIRNTLNNIYYNTLSSIWQNKIATHAYKVGGMGESNVYEIPKTAYAYEVGSNSSSTTDTMKIGLMYASDFVYAASNDYWTESLESYDSAISDNWMYLMEYEWTISRISDYPYAAFAVHLSGGVSIDIMVDLSNIAVRPSFYLNSSVNYVSGSGTSADPIRIS